MLLLFNIERIQERPSNLKFGYLKKMLPQLTFNLIHITESNARKVDLVQAGAGGGPVDLLAFTNHAGEDDSLASISY